MEYPKGYIEKGNSFGLSTKLFRIISNPIALIINKFLGLNGLKYFQERLTFAKNSFKIISLVSGEFLKWIYEIGILRRRKRQRQIVCMQSDNSYWYCLQFALKLLPFGLLYVLLFKNIWCSQKWNFVWEWLH